MNGFNKITAPAKAEAPKAKTATKWVKGEVMIGYATDLRRVRNRFGAAVYLTMVLSAEDGTVTGQKQELILSTGLLPYFEDVKDGQLIRIECTGTNKPVTFDVAAHPELFLKVEA